MQAFVSGTALSPLTKWEVDDVMRALAARRHNDPNWQPTATTEEGRRDELKRTLLNAEEEGRLMRYERMLGMLGHILVILSLIARETMMT